MSLAGKVNELYDGALALVFPLACAACGASVESRADAPACAACWHETHIFSDADALCWKCGAPAPDATVTDEQRASVRCGRCDGEAFDAARAVGAYEGGLRAAVLGLKREPQLGGRLATLLAEAQKRPPLDAATRIVPVPLHPERERERGFNQAAVLGRALAARAGLPLDEWSLIRVTHTERHRAGMDRRARRETVEDAFEVRRPRLVEGERILLVDDVFTTGATIAACASALRAAGAREVFALTLARA